MAKHPWEGSNILGRTAAALNGDLDALMTTGHFHQ